MKIEGACHPVISVCLRVSRDFYFYDHQLENKDITSRVEKNEHYVMSLYNQTFNSEICSNNRQV